MLTRPLLRPWRQRSSSAGTTFSTSYTLGGTAVDVAPNATVNSAESGDLLWATATIENPVGSGDKLSATVPSGSDLSQDFSGDTLTISGLADAATYQTALQLITYSTTATTPGSVNPTVSIMASDGTMESTVYKSTIEIQPGSQTTTAPTVTTNPTSATVDAVGTATFTAAASGTPTPTVQWEVSTDGGTTFTDISGATSTTYTFTATASQTGNEYKAVFTNNVARPP